MSAKSRVKLFLGECNLLMKDRNKGLYSAWSKLIKDAVNKGKTEVWVDVPPNEFTTNDVLTTIGIIAGVGFTVQRMDYNFPGIYRINWEEQWVHLYKGE